MGDQGDQKEFAKKEVHMWDVLGYPPMQGKLATESQLVVSFANSPSKDKRPQEQQVEVMKQDERRVGAKYSCTETDLQRYGPDSVKILKLSDERKHAKRGLIEAQVVYENACAAMAAEKQRLDDIFAGLGSDGDMTVSKD